MSSRRTPNGGTQRRDAAERGIALVAPADLIGRQKSAKPKRTRHSTSPAEPHWQPISQLPLIAELIDGQWESATDVLHSLQLAQERPGVLDDATVDRVIRVHAQQRDDMWLFEDQLRRWATETLTETQRREVDRLTGQAKKLREALTATVTLAGELKSATIESLMKVDDAELGLQTLLRGGFDRFRPVTREQEVQADQIDA